MNRIDVIHNLESCLAIQCDDCIQEHASHYPLDCEAYDSFIRSAVELLRAQEPRVLTLDEVVNSDAPIVVDYYDMPLCYASFERDVSSKKWARFYTFGEEDFIKLLIEDYNKRNTWRCWSSKPTDEQREATSWTK